MEEALSSSNISAHRGAVLPNHKNLSRRIIAFLDDHLLTHGDLSSSLATKLNENCEELETHLASLKESAGNLIVSWISRSIQAKTALHKVKNLSICITQQCGSLDGSELKKAQKILGEDMHSFAKELSWIDDIRSYTETALKLEAHVGDLEDAILCARNWHTGNITSAYLSCTPTSANLRPIQEKLFDAIEAMDHLESRLVTVAKLHPRWRHLIRSVDTRVDKNLAVFRIQILTDYRALLASVGWPPKLLTSKIENGTILYLPNPLVLMQEGKRKSYSDSFLLLCALQQMQTRREERQLGTLKCEKENLRLWAMDELVSLIACRLEHHFSKWADQPELIFALVYRITRDFVIGVEDVLQPLIDRARLMGYSAKEAWVDAMVQMLSGFLAKNVFPVLTERYKEKKMRSEIVSSWVHLVDLMVAFDSWMKSLVNTETSLLSRRSERLEGVSRGITVLWIFCDRREWLKIWAKIELKDAQKKLKAEIKDVRVWLVSNKDRRSTIGKPPEVPVYSGEEHKAPLIAEYALNVAWEMIERGQNLPAILPRSQFIRSTSARFLWYFFKILILHCAGTESHTESPTDDLLTRLCTSINAARYCESKLVQWCDGVSFLEMRIAEDHLNVHSEDDAHLTSSYFGEEIKSLIELETSWLMDVVALLLYQFETACRDYVKSKGRFEQENKDFGRIIVEEAIDFIVSVEFVEALDALRSQLEDMRMSLNLKDFLDLWRSIADGLDHFIFFSILMDDTRFSDYGISQLGADMTALYFVFQPFCSRPEAFFPLLGESLKLLKMNAEHVMHLRSLLSDEARLDCLLSFGVSHISLNQAWKILSSKNSGVCCKQR